MQRHMLHPETKVTEKLYQICDHNVIFNSKKKLSISDTNVPRLRSHELEIEKGGYHENGY